MLYGADEDDDEVEVIYFWQQMTTTHQVISLHAGPEGRFEKEGREIARHRQLIVSKLDELVPGMDCGMCMKIFLQRTL